MEVCKRENAGRYSPARAAPRQTASHGPSLRGSYRHHSLFDCSRYCLDNSLCEMICEAYTDVLYGGMCDRPWPGRAAARAGWEPAEQCPPRNTESMQGGAASVPYQATRHFAVTLPDFNYGHMSWNVPSDRYYINYLDFKQTYFYRQLNLLVLING